jgi:hypothetical protein
LQEIARRMTSNAFCQSRSTNSSDGLNSDL